MSRSGLVKEGDPGSYPPRVTLELSATDSEPVASRGSIPSHSFVGHLLAIPNVGDDADFERERSGPRSNACDLH